MLDLTVIILTYNEELHIRRCLERILPITERVVVVDSLSTDKTKEICEEYPRVDIVEHAWPGTQAKQFNWALDNVTIDTEWVLRLDADEYLMPGEDEKLKAMLPTLSQDITGVTLLLERFFMGRMMKHGGTRHLRLMRLFRNGCAKCEQRDMDEHTELICGQVFRSSIRFADDSRIPISRWIQKHIGYAEREVRDILREKEITNTANSEEIQRREAKKGFYNRLPLFLRAFAYFFYRYIIRLGFLDGKEGFLWHFMQAWWYRTLVDTILLEEKRNK